MDALVWGFTGMRRIETFIVVADASCTIATRGPIVDRWNIHCRIGLVEDAHRQALRDTEEAETEGQQMSLPPTRITLADPEIVALTDPRSPPLKDGLINDLLQRGVKAHLKRGLMDPNVFIGVGYSTEPAGTI